MKTTAEERKEWRSWLERGTDYSVTKKVVYALLDDLESEHARAESLAVELAKAKEDAERIRTWLDGNTTFYDVDADWPVDAPNVPTLAQVSERIWYHATDDQKSYPFSAIIDAAIKAEKS